jgi:hypothetical protein
LVEISGGLLLVERLGPNSVVELEVDVLVMDSEDELENGDEDEGGKTLVLVLGLIVDPGVADA